MLVLGLLTRPPWYAAPVRPHPRLRKSIKWAGAAAVLLLLSTWLVSGWWCLTRQWPSGRWAAVGFGQLFIGRVHAPTLNALPPGWWTGRTGVTTTPQWHWWLTRKPTGPNAFTAIPLWPALPALTLLTAAAWRQDAQARARSRPGHCPCGYSLAGLTPGQPCPECGCVRKSDE